MSLRAVAIATAILGITASAAHADLPNGLTLSFNKLLIHENGAALAQPSDPNEATWHYCNKAHCTCALKQPDSAQATFAWEIIPVNSTTALDRPAEIYTGTSCDNLTTQAQTCVKITGATIPSISTLQSQNKATVELNLFDLMNPEPDADMTKCQERTLSAATWIIVDGDANGEQDYFVSKTVDTDTLAPPLPKNFKAAGAENAIDISWEAPVDSTDIYAYQALCAAEDGTAAVLSSRPSPRYDTAAALCGEADSFDFTVSDIDTGDLGDAGTVGTPAAGIGNFDPAFLCGDQPSATATSLRITGLENGVNYQVAVVAVDKFGNVRGTYFNRLLKPTPATDFWEDLHNRGSQVEGGFCLLNETYGDDSGITNTLRDFRDTTLADSTFGRALTRAYYATLGQAGGLVRGSHALRVVAGIVLLPLVAFALLWHALTLPGLLALLALLALARRHRQRLRIAISARLAGAVATGAVLLLAGAARADDSFDPNWNEPGTTEDSQFAEDVNVVKWHVGVRVGPYTPQIDAQLGGMSPGPYAQMFGGYSILPMIDVDRIIWRGHGQLAVGGNIGFLNKKAHAWVDGSDPADPARPRAKGDENKFRVIPFALTATYRWTYLDDEHGIPIVPYLKAGLAYYTWWMDGPSGDFSKACQVGTTGMGCPTDSAYGATLGVQGTIGLAIRAERLDQSAANSMKESGLLHAGFYAELQLAKVDGFGSDKKLAVGDSTWFAGVDFEF
ncbi:MAG: MXAN_2562 family outer membrane beta-barrel protein [Proteobacteria bacterium]|nr:MXAN_2562 family outer membrane beta-barrel protein [Pseudomonadota bacterium]